MSEKPIIFSGPMVRALQEGRKTQTRRLIKRGYHDLGHHGIEIADAVLPARDRGYVAWYLGHKAVGTGLASFTKAQYPVGFLPRYEVGDTLWVRETWWREVLSDNENAGFDDGTLISKHSPRYADGLQQTRWHIPDWKPGPPFRKMSPIFMPRWASRLTLLVTAVRVERVQEITQQGAMKEGFEGTRSFSVAWEAMHGKRGLGWHANPWVWVYEFEVIASDRREERMD